MEMQEGLGLLLSMIGVSLTILEIFIVLMLFIAGLWGYTQIRGIRKNIKEIVADSLKDFMESKAGKRLLDETHNSTDTIDENERSK